MEIAKIIYPVSGIKHHFYSIMQIDSFINKLKEELTKDLPGEEFQNRMASPYRYDNNPDFDNHQKGSVLLLLYPSDNQIKIVFIRKPFSNGIHGGQISLPGGRIESSDTSSFHAALRETKEEIGVKPDDIQILGSLSSVYVSASNFVVFPVVGFIDFKPEFQPSANEVQQIIEVSLQKFLYPENMGTKFLIKDNKPFKAPSFNVDDHQIWGATAMILGEFIEVVRRTDFYN